MAINSGCIILWSGAIVDIPSGWFLCNGNNGTPDLRNRFVIGAGDTYNPNDTGGAFSHNHTFTGGSHTHTIPGGTDIQSGAGYAAITDPSFITGTTDPESTIPPYFALAYIMKS